MAVAALPADVLQLVASYVRVSSVPAVMHTCSSFCAAACDVWRTPERLLDLCEFTERATEVAGWLFTWIPPRHETGLGGCPVVHISVLGKLLCSAAHSGYLGLQAVQAAELRALTLHRALTSCRAHAVLPHSSKTLRRHLRSARPLLLVAEQLLADNHCWITGVIEDGMVYFPLVWCEQPADEAVQALPPPLKDGEVEHYFGDPCIICLREQFGHGASTDDLTDTDSDESADSRNGGRARCSFSTAAADGEIADAEQEAEVLAGAAEAAPESLTSAPPCDV
eukprot:TRINITY_DN40768_c0_g1_i1.p1 TRINITY_DN40768_c0_g1~~TRINITY_DN40768_c0_g1_i1.p1  ORF type:complete len:308 (+),score=80.73 TRINITY_DN40768_c0_g1_i1:83-925(+)